jgi:hypothetical protein
MSPLLRSRFMPADTLPWERMVNDSISSAVHPPTAKNSSSMSSIVPSWMRARALTDVSRELRVARIR